jgi:hypothetical protein
MAMIKEKSRELGIKDDRKSSVDLIKSIQIAEGNFPCYKTAHGFCNQQGCMWRVDCPGKR